jgi:hypothetical protein
MTEWADKAFEKVEAERKAAGDTAIKLKEESKIKRDEAPLLWNALKLWLHENVLAFNQKCGREALTFDKTTASERERVSYHPSEGLLEVIFDNAAFSIFWNGTNPTKSGRVSVDVRDGKKAAFYDGDRLRTLDSLGGQILNSLLNLPDGVSSE